MKGALIIAAALALAGPALAQDAALDDDWDFAEMPEERTLTAVLAFDGGPGVVVVCRAGVLEAAITGLPPRPEGSLRGMDVSVDGGQPQPEGWFNTTGGVDAFSSTPAGFARSMRQGSVLTVRTRGADDRPRRIAMPLPTSHQGLDRVLTACGRPLEDAWDAIPLWNNATASPASVTFSRPIRPDFPERAVDREISKGYVVLACLIKADGRLDPCRIETEDPTGFGFGEAALDAARSARLDMPTDASLAAGRRLVTTVNFWLAD